MAVVNVGEKVR